MSAAELEHVLRDFGRLAKPVAQYDSRECWRFEWNKRLFLLHFYERRNWTSRLIRGNIAHRRFFGLQTLQKLGIPAPRAVAQLAGFRIGDRVGDAVIVELLDGSVTLQEHLLNHELAGDRVADRRSLAEQVRTIVHQLGRAKLGHSSLSLESFILYRGKVLLADAQHVHRGGLKLREVMRLGHWASRFATIGEMRRAWALLQPGAAMPRWNPFSPRLWRRTITSLHSPIRSQSWHGAFAPRSQFAQRGAVSSQWNVTRDDWLGAWPQLLRKIESRQLTYLKRDASGEVMEAQIELAGRTIPVVIKRPRNKFWYRYVLDIVRPSRARRMWTKTWKTIIRGLPTEWPMLLMERRVLGYVVDAIVVFERVEGTTLDKFNLDALAPHDRKTLFRRAGRTLRILEQRGLSHMDAKSTNWIITTDAKRGPIPVMIDLFGIRMMIVTRYGWGIRRLLRAMRQHSQYTPTDSLNLCLGYAPFSRIEHETH